VTDGEPGWEVVRAALPDAVVTLKKLMKSKDEYVRLEATRMLLDVERRMTPLSELFAKPIDLTVPLTVPAEPRR
jgi:hypothetical protein